MGLYRCTVLTVCSQMGRMPAMLLMRFFMWLCRLHSRHCCYKTTRSAGCCVQLDAASGILGCRPC